MYAPVPAIVYALQCSHKVSQASRATLGAASKLLFAMTALLSDQQVAAAMRVGAYPYLVMMGDVVPPKLARGKVFVLQFDVKTGEPLGRYVTPPYELIYWQSNDVHRWMLRVLANGGHNVIYTSEPFDGWVVDAGAQAKQITFKDQLGRDAPIRFQAFLPKAQVDPATAVPQTPKDEIINLETPSSSKPDASLAGLVLGALQKQNRTMSGILQKADRTLEETKSMVTGVLKYVHEEYGATLTKELGSSRGTS